jgi:hypothetical protein
LNIRQQDLVVCCICDGFDKIPDSFKKYALKYKLFDERVMQERGLMEKDRDGKWKMKSINDLMDKGIPEKNLPKNILHLF